MSKTKRITALLLCILLAALLFAGCADGKTKLTGKIAHIYGGTLLIAGDDGELYFAAIGDADTGGVKLQPGQRAEMEYRGGLKETYPAEMNKLEKITLTGEANNIIDLYINITKEAIGESSPSSIAFDFSGTKHLMAAEQEAVGYICWTELDAEPYYGTEEELLEQNVLTEKNASGVFLRGGHFIQYIQDEEDPFRLTVKNVKSAKLEQKFVYQLAVSGDEWTATLIEESEQEETE